MPCSPCVDQLGEATPYEIKQAMDSSIENFWPVPHTTAYEEPARLAGGGYMSVQPGGGRPPPQNLRAHRGGPGGAGGLGGGRDLDAAADCATRRILKVFAGGDPFALLEPRRSWHQEKLAELQGYLEAVRGEEGWRGSELALTAGIAYHRKMLEMLDELDPST